MALGGGARRLTVTFAGFASKPDSRFYPWASFLLPTQKKSIFLFWFFNRFTV